MISVRMALCGPPIDAQHPKVVQFKGKGFVEIAVSRKTKFTFSPAAASILIPFLPPTLWVFRRIDIEFEEKTSEENIDRIKSALGKLTPEAPTFELNLQAGVSHFYSYNRKELTLLEVIQNFWLANLHSIKLQFFVGPEEFIGIKLSSEDSWQSTFPYTCRAFINVPYK
jgi:hypothetical protein